MDSRLRGNDGLSGGMTGWGDDGLSGGMTVEWGNDGLSGGMTGWGDGISLWEKTLHRPCLLASRH